MYDWAADLFDAGVKEDTETTGMDMTHGICSSSLATFSAYLLCTLQLCVYLCVYILSYVVIVNLFVCRMRSGRARAARRTGEARVLPSHSTRSSRKAKPVDASPGTSSHDTTHTSNVHSRD